VTIEQTLQKEVIDSKRCQRLETESEKLKLKFYCLEDTIICSKHSMIRLTGNKLQQKKNGVVTLHFLAVGRVTANSELEDNSPKFIIDYKL
jgi:hypothetical protein